MTRASANRGKFRNFLLSCLKNFLINEHKHQNRQKRKGGYNFISLNSDDCSYEMADTKQLTPEEHYDKCWAETVVENALTALEKEWKRDDKPFDQLKAYLINSEVAPPFSQQAEVMSVSEAAVHRIRQRYAQLVRDEVTSTVTSPIELEDELRHLLNMLSSC